MKKKRCAPIEARSAVAFLVISLSSFTPHPKPHHRSRPALHRLRPVAQKSLDHLLSLVPQRSFLQRQQPKPFHRRAPHHIAFIPSQQRHRPRRPQSLHPGMRHPRHHHPKMPPRPRLLYRQSLQQPGKLIGITLKQPAIQVRNPPCHIRRPLPDLDILAEKLPHQRPNRRPITNNLLSERPSQRQTPPCPSQLEPQRFHAAKYISVFPHGIRRQPKPDHT